MLQDKLCIRDIELLINTTKKFTENFIIYIEYKFLKLSMNMKIGITFKGFIKYFIILC